MRFSFFSVVMFFVLSLHVGAASAGPGEKNILSEEEIVNMQVQRAVQRDNLIQKNKVSGTTDVKKSKQQYALALKSYGQGDYAGARKLFESAILANPLDDAIYFDYGKCLYRQGSYKLALSIFLMLENTPGYENQSEFYSGLTLFRLKNYDVALRKFIDVQEDDASDLAPASAFYAGQISFAQRAFGPAKIYFEFVLDKSKDPKMDAAAEKFIDQIAHQERLQAKLDNKFGYSLNIGFIYDTNVLNIDEQNSATSLKAYRLNYGGTAYYRAMNKANETWSLTFMFYDLYSTTTSFKSDSTIQGTDPMILDFSFPYSLNFALDKKASSLTISPAIQSIYMTKTSNARELVFTNVSLNSSLAVTYSNYFTMFYRLDLSREQSYITQDSADDEQTAKKYGLTISSYYLLDRNNNENIILDLQYLLTDALGINSRYIKYLGSLGYSRNLGSAWSLYVKADYSTLDYDKSTLGRKDKMGAGYLGASYAVTATDLISLGFGYQANQSTVDLYKYNKMIVSAIYTLTHF